MTVKDVIKTTASLLNKQNVVKYLDSNTVSGDCIEESKKLIDLLQVVLSELALNDFYAIYKESVSGRQKVINYTGLTKPPVKIIKITDGNLKELDFEVSEDCVTVNGIPQEITYAYVPKNVDLQSQLNFLNPMVSESWLAFGVAAEYALTICEFDMAIAFHEKFVQAVKQARKLYNAKIKQRSWV